MNLNTSSLYSRFENKVLHDVVKLYSRTSKQILLQLYYFI